MLSLCVPHPYQELVKQGLETHYGVFLATHEHLHVG
jgi:hypothetical protein